MFGLRIQRGVGSGYCCSCVPKWGLSRWERFSLFFHEVIRHSSVLKWNEVKHITHLESITKVTRVCMLISVFVVFGLRIQRGAGSGYCCSCSPKWGLGRWERFSLFFREVISHSFLFGERRRFWERFSLFFREVISHSSLLKWNEMKHIIHFESITKVRRPCILISVFCCLWITNPAWCGLGLLLFLYSEMRLGSLGTVRSFLSQGN